MTLMHASHGDPAACSTELSWHESGHDMHAWHADIAMAYHSVPIGHITELSGMRSSHEPHVGMAWHADRAMA